MGKQTFTHVELVVPAHSMKRKFTLEAAERLLRVKDNGGWQLPSYSEFEFDLTNGIRRKQPKRIAEEPEK